MQRDVKKQNGNKQTNTRKTSRASRRIQPEDLVTDKQLHQTKISEDGKAATRTELAETVAVFSADPPL